MEKTLVVAAEQVAVGAGTSRQFIPGQSYYNGDGDGGLGPGGTPTTASGGGGGEPGQRGGHGHYLHPAISSDSLQTFKAQEILSPLAGDRGLKYYRVLVDKLVEVVPVGKNLAGEIARVPGVVEAVY